MSTGGQGGGAVSAEASVGQCTVAERAERKRRRASWRVQVLAGACLLPAILLIGATLTALVASGPALAKQSTSSWVQGGAPAKANSPARQLMAIAARRLTTWIVLGPGL